MIVGFVFACQGGVAVTMSYFPELFGSRYRYAGVTLGREFAAVLGGGFAPLIAVALMNAFDSWVPVAIYMSVAMAITFGAALFAPETRDRDLLAPENATDRVQDLQPATSPATATAWRRTMKAIVIQGKLDLVETELPTPEPQAGQVRLRMAYGGICGSDLHYYHEGANG